MSCEPGEEEVSASVRGLAVSLTGSVTLSQSPNLPEAAADVKG